MTRRRTLLPRAEVLLDRPADAAGRGRRQARVLEHRGQRVAHVAHAEAFHVELRDQGFQRRTAPAVRVQDARLERLGPVARLRHVQVEAAFTGRDRPALVAVAVRGLVFLTPRVAGSSEELGRRVLHRRRQHGLRRQPAVARETLAGARDRIHPLLAKPLGRGYLPPQGGDSFLPAACGPENLNWESSPYFVYSQFEALPVDTCLAKGFRLMKRIRDSGH